jgi:hypothetical protein
MPQPACQKITFGEMRASGVRGLIVYCADYRCSHSVAISGDSFEDDAFVRHRAAVHLPGMRPERRFCPPEF